MNIYCNGDSFTSGLEILDYQFSNFPGYSPTGSYLATDANYNWARVRQNHGINFFGSYEELILQERSAAWPGQLKKIDNNINFINSGVAGSSITGIANRTTIDLLKNKNIKFDFIFIQLTSPTRFEFYNSDLSDSYFMREKPMGWIEFLPNQFEKEIAKGYMKYYKNEDYSIKYLYVMTGLKNLIKGITGIDPIFFISLKVLKYHILDPLEKNVMLKNNDIIQTLINESGILEIPEENCMDTTQIKNNFLFTPMKHFELRCHEEFAKTIYQKYIK